MLDDLQASTAEHYTTGGLGARILAALEAAGKSPDASGGLGVDDLEGVDAFHIRGRAATAELAGWAEPGADQEVLDAGCGIGGTSRWLADRFGCRVVGVDLTEECCEVAEDLTRRVGLADRVSFRRGSVLELPFEDGRFDLVWTEHVQMNVPDKARFYGELARVLRPGGQLAYHDLFAGEGGPPHFPVPWAGDPSISHLATLDELDAALEAAGLESVRREDRTAESIAFFRGVFERLAREGRPPLGLHVVMGESGPEKLGNVLRGLEEGRVRVEQALLRKPR